MDVAVGDESILQRFDCIRDDIVRLVSKGTDLQGRVKQLEVDLDVYKRIFSQTNAEKRRLEDENEQLKHNSEKQKENSEKQTQASRVVVLLDGDGAIFTPQLIALGQTGAHKAASKLSDSVKDYILSLDEIRQFQLSVFIFFNKKGLIDTFNRCSYHSARVRLEDFVTGFNQASERFIMVDVGSGKEAADSKIKAFLEDEIHFPQTYKILFGGCHDNGYVTTIRSHITSGFKRKFILLQSYTEHAAGFDDLELPILPIPGLFIPQKLVASTPSQDPLIASRGLSPPLSDAPIQDSSPVGSGRGEIRRLTQEMGSQALGSLSSPAFYSNLALSKAERRPPILSETTSDCSNTDDTGQPTWNKGAPRLLDPKLPLSQQRPPPCTAFYLWGCKYGSACRYGHDYVLQPQHYAEIKSTAKKMPCPAANMNVGCPWADTCYHGHICPGGPKCFFLKKGKCRFVGADMHKPKDAKGLVTEPVLHAPDFDV